MLKTIKLIAVSLLFASLVSCGGGSSSDNSAATSNSDSTTSANNDTTTSATTATSNNDTAAAKTGTTIFKAELKGSGEVPANPSTATGTSTLTYNNATKTFTDVTSYKGLMPSMGHIHKAAAGTNGPVVFPFIDLKSPITLNSPTLTDDQVDALFKDSMYVNLHTTKYPGGEIRGQLIKQ